MYLKYDMIVRQMLTILCLLSFYVSVAVPRIRFASWSMVYTQWRVPFA